MMAFSYLLALDFSTFVLYNGIVTDDVLHYNILWKTNPPKALPD
jgi:hypothetical protein